MNRLLYLPCEKTKVLIPKSNGFQTKEKQLRYQETDMSMTYLMPGQYPDLVIFFIIQNAEAEIVFGNTLPKVTIFFFVPVRPLMSGHNFRP